MNLWNFLVSSYDRFAFVNEHVIFYCDLVTCTNFWSSTSNFLVWHGHMFELLVLNYALMK